MNPVRPRSDASIQQPPWRERLVAPGIAILRVGFGLVFLSNGLAKATGWDGVHPFPGFLIDYDGAKGILQHDVQSHPVGPYKNFIDGVVLENYALFGVLLTVTEIFIGLTLVTGAFANLGALIGATFALHLNFANWDRDIWMWEYAVEWIPLIALALIGSGSYLGLDGRAARLLPPSFRRWPLVG
jgi:uncharacterized membrane protein YphA (DoxX/SURF4 family)